MHRVSIRYGPSPRPRPHRHPRPLPSHLPSTFTPHRGPSPSPVTLILTTLQALERIAHDRTIHRDPEIVRPGVLTRYDPDAFRRADCVAHSLLAHAMPTDTSHRPVTVRVDDCDRLRQAAKVTARGAVDFDEIGAMIEASCRGLMLLDLSEAAPQVFVRSPQGPAARYALVLRVAANHYEPIVHHGQCVLREWSDALQVMRTITCAPSLKPQRITCRGDAPMALLGFKVGGRMRKLKTGKTPLLYDGLKNNSTSFPCLRLSLPALCGLTLLLSTSMLGVGLLTCRLDDINMQRLAKDKCPAMFSLAFDSVMTLVAGASHASPQRSGGGGGSRVDTNPMQHKSAPAFYEHAIGHGTLGHDSRHMVLGSLPRNGTTKRGISLYSWLN